MWKRAAVGGLLAASLVAGQSSLSAPASTAAASTTPQATSRPAPSTAAPTVAQLADSSALQQRDLSLPGSRLVLNPTVDALLRDTPLQQTGGPTLPLSAAYYSHDHFPNTADVLTVGERPTTTPAAVRPEVASSFADSFGSGTGAVPGWRPGPNTAVPTMATSTMSVTSAGGTPAYGWVARDVTVDLDADPVLRVSVLTACQGWGLKVNADTSDTPATPDTVVQPTTSTPGVYRYDLVRMLGWHGVRTFQIRVFTSGAANTVKVDDIRMQTPATTARPLAFGDEFNGRLGRAWRPADNSSATTAHGSLRLATVGRTATAEVSRSIRYDVDADPYVQITVSAVTGAWALDATVGGRRTRLQPATSALGTFTYQLPRATGAHGEQEVTLTPVAVGRRSGVTVDDIQASAPDAPAVAVADDFDGADAGASCRLTDAGLDTGWQASPSTAPCAHVSGGVLHLTRNPASTLTYGSIQRGFSVDVTKYPRLDISLPALTGGWVLRVAKSPTFSDGIQLQPLSLLSGRFSYDLAHKTGWTGPTTFYVRIDAASERTGTGAVIAPDVSIDRLAVRAADQTPWVGLAGSTTNTWRPDRLAFGGRYADGARIDGTDTFHDNDSVVRSMTVRGLHGPLQLSGLYRGSSSWNARTATMTIVGKDATFALRLPTARSTAVRFYPDRAAMLRGGPATTGGTGASGYWSVTLSGLRSSTVAVGIGFVRRDQPSTLAASRAAGAVTPAAVRTDPARRATGWDAFLSRVPRPHDFGIGAGLPSEGVTPAAVRAEYYRAWVALIDNVLQPQTELGDRLPQVLTGKASLYHAGPAGASGIATWDVDAALQQLAYVDPRDAWGGLASIAERVPADGHLDAESLAPREMQTAWILYQVTGDRRHLASVYPALGRLLRYRIAYPSYSAPPRKDSEFGAAELVDLVHAQRIAAVLGDTVTDWAGLARSTYADVTSWFWATPDSTPSYTYSPASNTRGVGPPMSITTLLDIPGLDAARVASTERLFASAADPTLPFDGFGYGGATDVGQNDVRYFIVDETAYGLLAHGHHVEAQQLAMAIERDTVRADQLSERFQWGDNMPPRGEGNTPSDFGAAELIWAVWLANGYRLDDGTPAFTALNGIHGGVDGLAIRGRQLDVTVAAGNGTSTGTVRLGGSLVRPTPSCRTLRVEVGDTVSVPASCWPSG